uniref:Inhibitor of growth protein N-terminal histone-binding domain-containing protein n=2 Tax=Clastoptera arizonana TaxID=38151 RepID=A0A1B6CF77_9HEMI
MINQLAFEGLYSATYVENYIDCVENLPDDLQRHLSRMRELDVNYQAFLKDMQIQEEIITRKDPDPHLRKRALTRIHHSLIAAQEVGDEKLQIVQQINDLIENKARQLDLDFKNLDFGKEQDSVESIMKETTPRDQGIGGGGGTINCGNSIISGNNTGERQSKRSRRSRHDNTLLPESIPIPEAPPPPELSIPMARITNSNTSKKTNSNTGKKKN